jgi:hypothetical protein
MKLTCTLSIHKREICAGVALIMFTCRVFVNPVLTCHLQGLWFFTGLHNNYFYYPSDLPRTSQDILRSAATVATILKDTRTPDHCAVLHLPSGKICMGKRVRDVGCARFIGLLIEGDCLVVFLLAACPSL